MEVPTPANRKTSNVHEPTFCCPDLDAFCLLDRLGLTVTGQHVAEDHTVLRCRVLEPDDPVERDCWCHCCGATGVPRDTVTRRLAHVPVGWRPTILQVTVRRYRCVGLRPRLAAGHQLGGGAEGEAFILGRPRRLARDRRANPNYTVICEEPRNLLMNTAGNTVSKTDPNRPAKPLDEDVCRATVEDGSMAA
jgi:hypothetical protein